MTNLARLEQMLLYRNISGLDISENFHLPDFCIFQNWLNIIREKTLKKSASSTSSFTRPKQPYNEIGRSASLNGIFTCPRLSSKGIAKSTCLTGSFTWPRPMVYIKPCIFKCKTKYFWWNNNKNIIGWRAKVLKVKLLVLKTECFGITR